MIDLLPIRMFGDPILRQVAAPVEIFDTKLAHLLDCMHATMDAEGGLGIAGNQVGVLLRVFAWREDAETVGTCINPKLLMTSDEMELDEEGCLSFPSAFMFKCERPIQAEVGYQDIFGGADSITVAGRLARTFLHEIDHLNGILFIDHLAAHDRILADHMIATGASGNLRLD